MKICYLFSNFHLLNFTGQPKIIFQLAQKAAQKGEKVYLISNAEKNKEFKKQGINIFLFKGLANLKTYIFNFLKILKYLQQIKPDIIHVHGSLLIIFVWSINRFLKIPLVCSLCETPEIIKPFFQKLLVFCLNKSKKTFVSSLYIKKQLVKKGLSPSKIIVARIGLTSSDPGSSDFPDPGSFWENPRFSEKQDLLFFGDSKKQRGFDIIFKLAKKLPHLKFKILLRWQGKECAQELKQMKKMKNVIVYFHPYSQSLQTIILKSKLIILPYRSIGVRPPLSLVESMALGKCVITSKMEGNKEIVKNNINGFLFDFKQFNKVIVKIKSLIKNNRQRQTIGKKAGKTIKQMYSNQEYNKILNYYESPR